MPSQRHERFRRDHPAEEIIQQIESLGYAVSVHRIPSSLLGTVGAFVEMHAVKVPEGEPVWMARNAHGDGEAEAFAAACVLAEMVGIKGRQ